MERDEVLEANKGSFQTFKIASIGGQDVLQFLGASEVEITWLRAYENGRLWALIVKPKSKGLVDTLGLHRELLVICSSFADFQPRQLNIRRLVEADLQTPGRLDDIMIVISGAKELNEVLQKLENPRQILLAISPEDIASALVSGHPSERFREILQERLYARDFFDRSGPVEGADFFGRQKLLQDIALQLERGSHVGLYGLRKVGKTSLIKALLARTDTLLKQAIFVHIDLLSVIPANRTYHFLLFQIAVALQDASFSVRSLKNVKRYDDIENLSRFEQIFDGDFREALSGLAKADRRLILVLDEIERLFPSSDVRNGFAGYDIFLEYIRGISQSAGPLSILVVGVNPHVSEAEHLGKRQNPMFGFFATRYAPPMSQEEVRDMVKTLGRSSGARFPAEAIDAIYEAVGGHPFLVRKYCSLLLRGRIRPTTIAPSDVLDNTEAFLREETSHFAEMVSVVKEYYPDEFRILHYLASSDNGVDVTKIHRRTLAHLEGYQLVEVDGGQTRMRYGLMREWMMGVTKRVAAEVSNPIVTLPASPEHGPSAIDDELVHDAIKNVEQELRRIVRVILDRRWGGRTEQKIELAVGSDAIFAAKARIDKSLRFRRESSTNLEEILDFLYLGDLQKIIVGNDWQEFRLVFGDKKETERRLQIISSARNEVQHFRALPSLELLKAYVASTELLSLLRDFHNPAS